MTRDTSLTDQLACVRREIKQRERVYPRLVGKGSMTQAQADLETDRMRAVEKTIAELADKDLLL